MHSPTYSNKPHPDFPLDLNNLLQVSRALYEGRASLVRREKTIDFDMAAQPLLNEIEACSRITAEDLSTLVTAT